MNPLKDVVQVPAIMIPSFRAEAAVQNKTSNKILFKTWGGLGDQLCAEPTIRYALNHFKGCEISLASDQPEFFQHLKFKRVFDLKDKDVRPNEENYLVFETICTPQHLTWEFFSHCLTHCVDFPSLCALRMQLPIPDREVRCEPRSPSRLTDGAISELLAGTVFVHAGKHWPSKTFPKDWWDAVLAEIRRGGAVPVLIGADADDNRGTVDVSTEGCIDMRNKLSIEESIWFLQRAKALLTNDSAPLHFAATGDAHIGYVATCKHPDYITHWRKGVFGWRMKNFGSGGIWDLADYCPNENKTILVDQVEEELLRSWLPDPEVFAAWAVEHALG